MNMGVGYKSKFKGVCIGSKCSKGQTTKYRASIMVKGRKINLGIFITEKEAAIAYDKYVITNKLNNKTNFLKPA